METVSETVSEALTQYSRSNAYPFHMPGHKRQKSGLLNPYQIDITEIDGFDNLHHAEGILLEAQKRAARLYGAEETHFLINGSTAGILSAVSACAKKTILMARNCHKAAYHAALVRNLQVVYVYPQVQETFGLNGGICPRDVEKALLEHPEIEAVLITSPTYDGVVSDVGALAEIARRYGKPLIVDEAHGAHFGFSEYFPENSVHLGADIVIHSLHKTLPSYTQTALLHVNGTRVDREKLRLFLQIYQTSSPSYLLMAGIDECVREIAENGTQAFETFSRKLERVYAWAEHLQKIRLADKSIVGKDAIYDFDRSKLIFSVRGCKMTGNELQAILRKEYDLELEMAAGAYALALASLYDTEEGFTRLMSAVTEIDRRPKEAEPEDRAPEDSRSGAGKMYDRESAAFVFPEKDIVTNHEIFCTINQAAFAEKRSVSFDESAGLVSGEFLYLYPPGIPLLAPGERISAALTERVRQYRQCGFVLQGTADFTGETIQVLI